MKKQLITIWLLLSLVCVSTTHAQVSVNTISANIGTIRTLFPDNSLYEGYQYSIYPEVQIGGELLIPSASWTLYWGYWTDGVVKAFPFADFVTYSYNSHIIGTRFNFFPQKLLQHWPLPIGIFGGIGHHFIAASYIGGYGFDGRPGQDFLLNATTIEVGLNTQVEILEPISIRAELQQFIPLGSNEFDRLQKDRRAYKVGLAFTF